ncbi:MAG: hypothetical protein IBJ16_09810 [Chitinophagaceae bacterium]|nr:hypothetical protein [Chitinophagaceae bacterium]
MATAIEEKRKINPDMPFKQALEEVHTSFGSLGLQEIIDSKTSAMSKQYGKMRRQLFWSYFTFPKIAFTFLLVIVCITMERVLPISVLPYILIVIGGVLLSLFVHVEILQKRFRKQQSQKLLMTDPQYFDFSFIYLILIFQFGSDFIKQGVFGITNEKTVNLAHYYFCIFFFLMYTVMLLARKEMIARIAEKAKEKYPVIFV